MIMIKITNFVISITAVMITIMITDLSNTIMIIIMVMT